MKVRFPPFHDLMLEQYLASELSPDDAARIELAAEERPDLKAHLLERRAEREAFRLRLRPLPVEQPAAERSWGGLAVALCAMGAVIAAALMLPFAVPSDVGIRGESPLSLSVAVLRGEQAFEYREGVLLLPHDRIRLTVTTPTAGFVTVLARDATGKPQTLYQLLEVPTASTVLPDSFELDETPGTETLTATFARERGALPSSSVEVKLVKGVP